MNIAVFGATGGTGLEVIQQALAQGNRVPAFVRDRARFPIRESRLRSVVGDALYPDCVSETV